MLSRFPLSVNGFCEMLFNFLQVWDQILGGVRVIARDHALDLLHLLLLDVVILQLEAAKECVLPEGSQEFLPAAGLKLVVSKIQSFHCFTFCDGLCYDLATRIGDFITRKI